MRIFLFLLLTTPAVAADLRVGAAATVITPPEGTPLAGYYSQRGSKTVLDDIHSKAIVLEVGDTKAALVVCDLISLPRHVVTEARRQIEVATGIPGAHAANPLFAQLWPHRHGTDAIFIALLRRGRP